MFIQEIENLKEKNFNCTNARLLWEWETIDKRINNNTEIFYRITERNAFDLPLEYEVIYNIRSFCGVAEKDENGFEKPIFADKFFMKIKIPNNYPSCDSKMVFRFMTMDIDGNKIPHPWHPNIRYFGDFAGRICLNEVAFGSFADIALFIERVSHYLKYEKYHAIAKEPYPEDLYVAEWVCNQAEPNGWIDDLKYNK
ncbi:MAG: hypothetical protein ACOYO1_00670 [Bacteroidales bacterium]